MIGKRTYSFEAFTTRVGVTAYGEPDVCKAAFDLVQMRCGEYEALLSRTREGSEVWRMNHASGESLDLDHRAFDLLEKALDYCRASEGTFDITVGSLIGLWDFRKGTMADPRSLEEAAEHVGFGAVQLSEGDTVALADPSAGIDLGGIAKGWIADSLYEELEELDLSGYVLDIGGNIIVGGRKPDGSAWKIGVKDPRDPCHNIAATNIEKGSIVTSGVYERAFARDGKLYHHVLDPKTGMPVNTDLLSATLVCDTSIDAEGFSTTVLALGSVKAQEYIRSRPEIRQAFLIDESMRFITYDS